MTTALEGGEWSTACPDLTLHPGNIRYSFYRRLGGPQDRSGRAENLAANGIRFWTVQTVVSHYTDWATRPTVLSLSKRKIKTVLTSLITLSVRGQIYKYFDPKVFVLNNQVTYNSFDVTLPSSSPSINGTLSKKSVWYIMHRQYTTYIKQDAIITTRWYLATCFGRDRPSSGELRTTIKVQ